MPKLKLLAILLFILVVSAPVSLGHAQVAPEVVVSQHPVLGDILTDADGNTLYLFTIDERNVSNCSGGCAGPGRLC